MAVRTSVEAVIRPYRPEDLEACQRIAGSAVDWTHNIDEQATHLVVAEVEGGVVGYAYMQVWEWNRVAWLGDFLVDDDYRGLGIGSMLLDRIIELARQDRCLILMDHPPPDHPVVTYYLRKGFRICGYNDSFLPDPGNRMVIFVAYDLAPPTGR